MGGVKREDAAYVEICFQREEGLRPAQVRLRLPKPECSPAVRLRPGSAPRLCLKVVQKDPDRAVFDRVSVRADTG